MSTMADNLVLTNAVEQFRPVKIKTPRFNISVVITYNYGDEESNDFLTEINNVLQYFKICFHTLMPLWSSNLAPIQRK